jgi:hypothetical protein
VGPLGMCQLRGTCHLPTSLLSLFIKEIRIRQRHLADFADQRNFGHNLIIAQTIGLATIRVTPPNLSLSVRSNPDSNTAGIIRPRSEVYDVGGIRGEYIMYILPDGRYVESSFQCQGNDSVEPVTRGRIHLIRGHTRLNQEADAIFQDYQLQAASGELPFKRFPLRAVRFLIAYPCFFWLTVRTQHKCGYMLLLF